MSDKDLPDLEELHAEGADAAAAEGTASSPEAAPEPVVDLPPSEFTDVPGVAVPGGAAAAVPTMVGPQPAHKQLYQFLWAGIAVLFGCLLPRHDVASGWMADQFQPELTGPIALWTVGGSITAFFALLYVAAQLYSIKYRKLLLSPIFIMGCVAFWSWWNVVEGMAASEQFRHGDLGTLKALATVKLGFFVDIWQHVGPNYLFAIGGSSYVLLIFLKELFGLGRKKKGDQPASGAERRGRARRR